MNLIPKPVISWAGHDTLVGELETRCSQTISKEPAMWRHSKYRRQYPVRIDASFTRFSGTELQSPIKVLSTGRPVRPIGSFQPLLYIYAISNNHTEYASGGRSKISSWLGYLQAGNISDWVILMIDAESQAAGPKMWQRPTVLQRIKKDFNITTDGFHFLQLPDPRAVEEKIFQDAWTTMLRALRKVILQVYHLTIVDYCVHLRLLEEARFTSGWDFFEYLDRKEELAQLYTVLNGYEDALYEYYELENFFSENAIALEQSDEDRPPWIRQLIKVSSSNLSAPSFLSSFPIVPSVPDSDQAARIRERQGTLFDIRTYLLSKQIELLSLLNKLHRVPGRVFACISSTLEQCRNLKICPEPVFESCWAFLVAIYCLELLRNRHTSDSRDVSGSINLILFNAFGPLSTRQLDATHPEHFSTTYQPHNNIFLRPSDSNNPVAGPLAMLADVIYTNISSRSTPQKSKTKTANKSVGFSDFCHSLVDLWLLAFVHLTRMGYLLRLWHRDDDLGSHAGALRALESTMHTCAKSTRTDLSVYGLSVHKHMKALLSSRIMYAEIYVAMGQILIGFFKLINRPNKAVYASTMLANFLQTVNEKQQACVLYTKALAAYLHDDWLPLAVQTCLRLACCLRSLLHDMKQNELISDSALARYLHCCFALSCTHPSILKSVIPACYLLPDMRPDYAIPFEVSPIIPSVDQLISADFWWYQCRKVLKLFPPDQIWDCTRMLQSPFRITTIELNGASDCGSQMITVSLEVKAHTSFLAQISASASYPRSDEWQLIMDYGHVTQILRHLTSSSKITSDESELIAVDLKSASSRNEYNCETRSSTTAWSSTDLTRSEATNPIELPVPPPSLVTKSTEELGPSLPRRRKSSFLDVAASWATTPAWKSQEYLNQNPDTAQVEHAYSKVGTVRRPTLSPIESPGVTLPDRSKSISTPPAMIVSPLHQPGDYGDSVIRRSVSCEPHSSTAIRSFSFSDFAPDNPLSPGTIGSENDRDRPFLSHYYQLKPLDQPLHFFKTHSKHDDPVQLRPGLNKITLISQSPGFLLPRDIRITVVSRNSAADKDTASDDSELGDIPLNLVYCVKTPHFHPSWANHTVLDSLLPKLYEAGQKEPLKSIQVILGLRQDIQLQLELGQLGLPVQPDAQINLYRIVHRLEPEPHQLAAPATGPTRGPKVVNDYHISPLFGVDDESVGNTGGRRGTKSRITNAAQLLPNDYRCELIDGPLQLDNKAEVIPVLNGSQDVDRAQPRTRYRLSRPVWIRAMADKDELAISMPSGYLYRLPVNIIRPLALTLCVYTFQKTNTVIFATRVACMDLHDNTFQPSSSMQQPSLKPLQPLTFRLTKCQLTITAPNIPDSVVNRVDAKANGINGAKLEHSSSIETGAESDDIARSGNQETKDKQKPQNCMVGIPVDARNMEAIVNRLSPVTLLWQLKFREFRHFVNSVLERFNEPPEARFQCTFTRLDDPSCESRLSFHRRISPMRQPPSDRPPALAGFLARNRKERGSS